MKMAVFPVIAVLILGGCVSNGMGPKETMGGMVGAAAGGVAGAQVGKGDGKLVGVAIGTLIGAYAGSQLGQSADRADALYFNRVNQ